MKQSYRSLLVLVATIMGVSLYAFLGPDIKEKNAEKQLQAVVATAVVNNKETVGTDSSTGLPLLKHGQNELLFTSEIQETIAVKLVEQLVAAGFFSSASSHKMILGREPNNYIIFYTVNSESGTDFLPMLKKMPEQLSSAVFNHQPVVMKLIDEEKNVLQVVM